MQNPALLKAYIIYYSVGYISRHFRSVLVLYILVKMDVFGNVILFFKKENRVCNEFLMYVSSGSSN